MATTGLEVRMFADPRELAQVARFNRTLSDLVAMLSDIDRAYLRFGSRPQWGIADLAKEHNLLRVRVEAQHPAVRKERPDLLASVDALLAGAERLEVEPELPRYFAAQTVERLAHVAQPGKGIRHVTLAAYNGSVGKTVELSETIEQNARKAVRATRTSIGSVSGYLEALGRRTKSGSVPVAIVGENGRQVVNGSATGFPADDLRKLWQHRVLASGQLKRNDRGQVVRIEIEALQAMPEGAEGFPSVDALLGSAPNFIGGRDVDEFFRELRGA